MEKEKDHSVGLLNQYYSLYALIWISVFLVNHKFI